MNPQPACLRPGSRFGGPIRLLILGAALFSFAGAYSERFPEDPVELFRQALSLESKPSNTNRFALERDVDARKKALDFRAANLGKTAAKLRHLSDLSRALLLNDWPAAASKKAEEASEYDKESREIERKIRIKLVKRFVDLVRESLSQDPSTAATIARQVATANMVSETVSGVADKQDEYFLPYRDLEPLVKELARVTGSNSMRVREAVARALGHFPKSSKEATAALRTLLSSNNPESVRKAAADALAQLVLAVNTNQPLPGSEPGVSSRERRRPGKQPPFGETCDLIAHVAEVAGEGLLDSAVGVRRQLANSLRQGAEVLAFESKQLVTKYSTDEPLPPVERDWSAEEAKRVEDRRKEVDADIRTMGPAMRAFRNHGDALLKTAMDRDTEVRVHVRRAIEGLSRARDLLHRLRDSIPVHRPTKDAPGKDKEKQKEADKDKRRDAMEKVSTPGKVRTVAYQEPVLALPAPGPLAIPVPVIRLPNEVNQKNGDDKKEKDAANDDKADKDADKDKEREIEKEKAEEAKDPDPLGSLLTKIGEGLVREGFRDPNALGRRAAFEALEAAGSRAEEFIPQLVQGLKDPDLFVRWIAARTLANLVNRLRTDLSDLERSIDTNTASRRASLQKAIDNLEAKGRETIVPALICGLDDEDLDARIAMARGIGYYGSAAVAAIQPMTDRLGKGDAEFRMALMKSLEEIGTASACALPVVARSFKDPDPRVRAEAARIVGRFGTNPLTRDAALKHIEGLRQLSTDPDSDVRRAASGAMLDIVPEGR